jgi:hypothetical protein
LRSIDQIEEFRHLEAQKDHYLGCILRFAESSDGRTRLLALHLLDHLGKLALVAQRDRIIYHTEFYYRAKHPPSGRAAPELYLHHVDKLKQSRVVSYAFLKQLAKEASQSLGSFHAIPSDQELQETCNELQLALQQP